MKIAVRIIPDGDERQYVRYVPDLRSVRMKMNNQRKSFAAMQSLLLLYHCVNRPHITLHQTYFSYSAYFAKSSTAALDKSVSVC